MRSSSPDQTTANELSAKMDHGHHHDAMRALASSSKRAILLALLVAAASIVDEHGCAAAEVSAAPVSGQSSPTSRPVAAAPTAVDFPDKTRWIVLQPSPQPKGLIEWLEKIIQLAAVLIGGIWVWANYLLNRTHRARLEARIAAELMSPDGAVKVVLGLKNVGLSKVELLDEGSAVRVFSLEAAPGSEVRWRRRMTTGAWESVEWIEPGESCEEQFVLIVPLAIDRPVKFELYVLCVHRSFPLRRKVRQMLRGSYVLVPPRAPQEVPT